MIVLEFEGDSNVQELTNYSWQTDISFVLTAGLSLLTCGLVQLFCDRLRHHTWRKLLEPLVVSFSDQQIIRGLSLSIATLYSSSACTLDAYRYNILCYLLLMTIVSHLSSILVLRSYVKGQVFLSCIRFGLVFAQIFFVGILFSSRVTDDFPTGIPNAKEVNTTALVLPAVCFEQPSSKPYTGLEDIPKSHAKDSASFTPYIILAIFYTINIIITSAHAFTYLFNKERAWQLRREDEIARRWTWFWWLGILRGLILLGAWVIWIWAVIKMYQLKGWMTNSGWMSNQNLQDDNQWTFGQLISIILLGAAPLTVLNAWSGMSFALTIHRTWSINVYYIGFELEREKKRGREDGEMNERILGSVGSPRTPRSKAAFGSQTIFGSRSTFEPSRTSNYSNPPEYYQIEAQPFMEGREQRRNDSTSWGRVE